MKSNPKRFWKYANSKRKTKTGISDLKYNNDSGVKLTSNDKEKADVLADFFSSVFTNEPQGEIPELASIPLQHKFVNRSFNEEDITKLLKKFISKQITRPDELHVHPSQF